MTTRHVVVLAMLIAACGSRTTDSPGQGEAAADSPTSEVRAPSSSEEVTADHTTACSLQDLIGSATLIAQVSTLSSSERLELRQWQGVRSDEEVDEIPTVNVDYLPSRVDEVFVRATVAAELSPLVDVDLNEVQAIAFPLNDRRPRAIAENTQAIVLARPVNSERGVILQIVATT